MRAEEGWGPATALRKTLLDAAGGTSINEVLHSFYTSEFPRDRIAALAPEVDQAAVAGDTVARAILDGAALQLAGLAHAVRGRLFLPAETVPTAYIGGVFRSSVLREDFRRRISSGPALHPPAIGALIEAYRAVNLKPSLVLASLF